MARRKSRKGSGRVLGGLLLAAMILVILTPQYRVLAVVLLGILIVAGWLWWRRSRLRTATAQELASRFQAIKAMSGAQFEIFTADLFRAMGHKATVMGGSGDQGVDLIVEYDGKQLAVQCKNYKRAVGNKPIQEVYAGAKYHRCDLAWVVAPSGYTKGAVELAGRVGVALYDASAIRTWIRRVDEAEKQRERAKESQPALVRQQAAGTLNEEAIGEARKRAFWHPHPDDLPPNT